MKQLFWTYNMLFWSFFTATMEGHKGCKINLPSVLGPIHHSLDIRNLPFGINVHSESSICQRHRVQLLRDQNFVLNFQHTPVEISLGHKTLDSGHHLHSQPQFTQVAKFGFCYYLEHTLFQALVST